MEVFVSVISKVSDGECECVGVGGGEMVGVRESDAVFESVKEFDPVTECEAVSLGVWDLETDIDEDAEMDLVNDAVGTSEGDEEAV